jgi:glycerol uptake facilitator-like aquaporin
MNVNLNRRIVAEAVGTAMLLAAVVGSGIMANDGDIPVPMARANVA